MRYLMEAEPRTVSYGRMEGDATLSRLFCAALVSKRFRDLLLADPALAIAQGYNGETFDLPPQTVERMARIRATSLSDFAAQFLEPEVSVQIEMPMRIEAH